MKKSLRFLLTRSCRVFPMLVSSYVGMFGFSIYIPRLYLLTSLLINDRATVDILKKCCPFKVLRVVLVPG
jgi:hypothetical protein